MEIKQLTDEQRYHQAITEYHHIQDEMMEKIEKAEEELRGKIDEGFKCSFGVELMCGLDWMSEINDYIDRSNGERLDDLHTKIDECYDLHEKLDEIRKNQLRPYEQYLEMKKRYEEKE